MKNLVSKYFKHSFDLSHAAFISIVAHSIFFATQPFGLFDKPMVQEKKYEKIRLEVVKKPEVVRVSQKIVVPKRAVLRKKPILSKPVVTMMNKPISQIKSASIQSNKPTVDPVINKAPRYHQTIPSPVGITQAGRFVAKNARVNVFAKINTTPTKKLGLGNPRTSRLTSSGVHAAFDRKAFQPRTRVDKVHKLNRGSVGYSALVNTHGVINNSFNPQIRNVAALSLDKQDEISNEELNELWVGYTTTVRQMIALAKVYPPKARDKGQQGKINLSFRLGKKGDVLKLLVENSSGYKMLDEAARNAVKNAGPFPPIPEKLNKQYVSLKLPVSFILR